MAIVYHISDLIGGGVQITPTSGESHVILEGVTIGSTTTAAIYTNLGVATGYVDLLIHGHVVGLSNAIGIANYSGSKNIDIFVSSTGTVTSFSLDGINVEGGDDGGRFVLRNDGLIRGEDEGVAAVYYDSIEIYNAGEISSSGAAGGSNGMNLTATTVYVENSGTIAIGPGGESAINFLDNLGSEDGDVRYVLNTGLITAPDVAINSEVKTDYIDNAGIIRGDLNLGVFESEGSTAYADVVNNTGTIFGDVSLGAGDDQFLGETGILDGEVSGGAGDDVIWSGVGNDLLNGGTGRDKLYGGAGNDTATYEDSSASVRVNLASNRGRGGEATGDWLFDIENLIGSNFDDTLIGDAVSNILEGGNGGDTLNGEGGNDFLFGEGGDDTLIGGDGNDILNGGVGRDILWGGDGVDIFEFLDVAESGIGSSRDVIKDFEQGVDLIDLAAMGATSFSAGGFTSTAGEVTYKLIGGGTKTVIEYDHDGDGAADFQILMTIGGFTITADDFVLG